MNNDRPKPIGSIWRPVRDIDPSLHGYAHRGARESAERWRAARHKLENPEIDRTAMDIWIREQRRFFAIETGQMEGLYLLKRGVTEKLLTEGFEGVRGEHSATDISDNTLKGLLEDQEAALDMMFALVKDDRPLTVHSLKGDYESIQF